MSVAPEVPPGIIDLWTPDVKFAVRVYPELTADALLQYVCRALGLRETWYFGVNRITPTGHRVYVPVKKKMQKFLEKDRGITVEICIACYPDTIDRLVLPETLNLFFELVSRDVMDGTLRVRPEDSIYLAAHMLHIRQGAYNTKRDKSGFIAVKDYIPEYVLNEIALSDDQWEERIVSWYSDLKGLNETEAKKEFLHHCSVKCVNFGTFFFPVKTKKKSAYDIALDINGLYLFDKDNRLKPLVSYLWGEIKSMSYGKTEFALKFNDRNNKEVKLIADEETLTGVLWSQAVKHYHLWTESRQPDDLVLSQMKTLYKKNLQKREAYLQRMQWEIALRNQSEDMLRAMQQQVASLAKQEAVLQQELDYCQQRNLIMKNGNEHRRSRIEEYDLWRKDLNLEILDVKREQRTTGEAFNGLQELLQQVEDRDQWLQQQLTAAVKSLEETKVDIAQMKDYHQTVSQKFKELAGKNLASMGSMELLNDDYAAYGQSKDRYGMQDPDVRRRLDNDASYYHTLRKKPAPKEFQDLERIEKSGFTLRDLRAQAREGNLSDRVVKLEGA
eukprot:Clim_evm47s128 gene=Clim_evmTU47s128